MKESRPLEGHTTIVTGADRGVGKGIALGLARAGSRVVVNYREARNRAEETVGELEELGAEAIAVQADVRHAREVRALVETAVSRFGRVNTFVNNAGVQTWKPLLEVEEDEWNLVIDTNLKGCFLCTQAAARHMKDQGGGSIVNIGSGSNRVGFPNLVAYTASKGGIETLTRVTATELGAYRIRVNCVAPGAIDIERTRLELPDYAATFAKLSPIGRVGTPADVADAVVFFASDASQFVTGQTLFVDGGLFTRPPW